MSDDSSDTRATGDSPGNTEPTQDVTHNSCTTRSENHVIYAGLSRMTGTLICPRLFPPSSSFSCRKSLNVPDRTIRMVGWRNKSRAGASAIFSFDRDSSSNARSGASAAGCRFPEWNVFHERDAQENVHVGNHTLVTVEFDKESNRGREVSIVDSRGPVDDFD